MSKESEYYLVNELKLSLFAWEASLAPGAFMVRLEALLKEIQSHKQALINFRS